jgi:hypothetical protein
MLLRLVLGRKRADDLSSGVLKKLTQVELRNSSKEEWLLRFVYWGALLIATFLLWGYVKAK